MITQKTEIKKLNLPLDHFLILSVIQHNILGVTFKMLQDRIAELPPDSGLRLGLQRSPNALYHVLSRMVLAGWIQSVPQGFQKPVQYCITSKGETMCEDVGRCMAQWNIFESKNALSPLRKDIDPVQEKENDLPVLIQTWIDILGERLKPEEIPLSKNSKEIFEKFANRNIPKLAQCKNTQQREEQLEEGLKNGFAEKADIRLTSDQVIHLMTELIEAYEVEQGIKVKKSLTHR